MAGKQSKKNRSLPSSGGDQSPDETNKESSPERKRTKTEVEALEAMLKKKGRRPQWDPLPAKVKSEK